MPDSKIVQGMGGVANAMGIQLQIIAYADPTQFPDGLDVTLQKPGALEVLGGRAIRIERGAMVCYLPPEIAQHVAAQIQRELAKIQAAAAAAAKPD